MLKLTRLHIVTILILISLFILTFSFFNPFNDSVSKQYYIAEDHQLRQIESDLSVKSIPTFVQAAKAEVSLDNEELDQKINEVISPLLQEGALVGISVRSSADGTSLYDHMGHLNLHPASNMKLITGITALEVLGSDYQFKTELWTDGEIQDGVLTGNLYIKGKGDPSLLEEDLEQFAKEIKSKGIHTIKGQLIGDDHWYDDVRYSQDLNWSDEMNYTGAAISALTMAPKEGYDAGAIIFNVSGANEAGAAPRVTVTPHTNAVTIHNDATTVSTNQAEGITIERIHGTNEFVIQGSIGIGGRQEVWRSVWEPTIVTLHILKQALDANGITLEGEISRGNVPDDAERLYEHSSQPLQDLIVPFMKLSHNSYGEILVKEMGKIVKDEGSWDAGLQVMVDELAELGVDPESILIRDGSGMSHKNLVKPQTFTTLLYDIQVKSWFEAFKQAQPIAGDDSRLGGGSLAHRMTEPPLKGNVFAKTGSLTGVNTLSGYATTVSGQEIIFSVMVNNYKDGYMPRIVDSIVKVLVEEL